MIAPARLRGSRAATGSYLLAALALGLVLGPPAALSAAADSSNDAPAGTHRPLTLVDGRLRSIPGEEAAEIVDVTVYCTACHGNDTAGTETGDAGHAEESAARDHALDVLYPKADPDYRAASELDPGLLLLDDRLTCVTCHAHDDPEHAPVLPTGNSEICRACHLM